MSSAKLLLIMIFCFYSAGVVAGEKIPANTDFSIQNTVTVAPDEKYEICQSENHIYVFSLPDKTLLSGPIAISGGQLLKAFTLGDLDRIYLLMKTSLGYPNIYLLSVSAGAVIQEFPSSIIIDYSMEPDGWLVFNQYSPNLHDFNPGENQEACMAYFLPTEEGEFFPDNPPLGMLVYLQKENQIKPLFTVSASSTLMEADKDPSFFAPDKLIDGTRDTCWAEGADGLGVGEWIELTSLVPVCITRLRVWGGYAHNLTTLQGNGAPAEMRVEINGNYAGYVIFPPPGDVFTEYVGEWRYGGDDAGVGVNRIKLTITKVKPGTTREDCCISEVEVE